MSTTNYLNELNALNETLISNVTANKYDYEGLQIANTQRQSFRRKVRKIVHSVYENADKLSKQDLKKFTDHQCKILLSAKGKTFAELNASQVYPSFEKLNETKKKNILSVHKFIIEQTKETEKKK